MGLFGSLKRNAAVCKAEVDFKEIVGQMGVVHGNIERNTPIEKEKVLKLLELIKKTYRVLHDEYEYELDNNTYYRSAYPNLWHEISTLKECQVELEEIIKTHYSDDPNTSKA